MADPTPAEARLTEARDDAIFVGCPRCDYEYERADTVGLLEAAATEVGRERGKVEEKQRGSGLAAVDG